jgi:hypothetical protein
VLCLSSPCPVTPLGLCSPIEEAMPIVNHDIKKNQFVGCQRAHFTLNGTGNTTLTLPLSGPKQIRKVTVVTGPNSTAVQPLTLQLLQQSGGTAITAALDIKQVVGTFVTANESALVASAVKMSEAFDGIALKVDDNAGADNWSFSVEIIYSPRTNVNNNVFMDEKIEGIL